MWQRNFQGKHFFASGIVFRNLQRQGFQYKFDKATAWRLAFRTLMANQHLKNLRLRRFINQRFEKNFLPFAVNQRLKIYVFGVGYKSTFWKLASSAFFVRVATQFSWQTFFVEGLSFKTCSPTCLQCNFCVKVVFLR